MKNSYIIGRSQTLARISRPRAELFLAEMANLSGDLAAIRRLNDHFPEIIPRRTWWVPAPFESREETSPLVREIENQLDDMQWLGEMVQVRDNLRAIWREPDLRRREWLAFRLRELLMAKADPRFIQAAGVISGPEVNLIDRLPPPSPFEQTIMQLLKSADRSRYCANADCPAPYFLAKRRSQKYCSDACSRPAQKEFKRRWWDEHGESWRKARRASAKKSQRKRGK